jgi:hypothetical protein
MNKLKVWVGILLVFFLGALAGSLGTGAYLKYRIERFAKGRRPPIKMVLMKKLSHELDLTQTQRFEIEKILDELEAELHELRQKHRPELDRLFDRRFDMIKEKLNDEQKSQLDRVREELKRPRPPATDKPH